MNQVKKKSKKIIYLHFHFTFYIFIFISSLDFIHFFRSIDFIMNYTDFIDFLLILMIYYKPFQINCNTIFITRLKIRIFWALNVKILKFFEIFSFAYTHQNFQNLKKGQNHEKTKNGKKIVLLIKSIENV